MTINHRISIEVIELTIGGNTTASKEMMMQYHSQPYFFDVVRDGFVASGNAIVFNCLQSFILHGTVQLDDILVDDIYIFFYSYLQAITQNCQ